IDPLSLHDALPICYCAYSGTQEMWHKPGNRVAGNDGIRIDANENFFVTQMLESKIQRIGFAGIGLSQNKNLAPDFFACKRGADNFQRLVLRSIINNDHSQIWIV